MDLVRKDFVLRLVLLLVMLGGVLDLALHLPPHIGGPVERDEGKQGDASAVGMGSSW